MPFLYNLTKLGAWKKNSIGPFKTLWRFEPNWYYILILGMYGTKEELEDSEDFFPFIYIPILIHW